MRRQYIIAAAGGLALIAVFFLALIRPTTAKISQARTDVESAQQEGRSLRLQLQSLQSAQRDAVAIQARLARFNVLLPSEPDLPTLIRQLQSAADSAGIDMFSIAPSPPSAFPSSTGVSSMQVVLQIRGGFFRLESFLARLEMLQRVVEVQNIAVSPTRDPVTGLDSLQTTVTLRTYIVSPGASLTGPSSTPTATPTPRTGA